MSNPFAKGNTIDGEKFVSKSKEPKPLGTPSLSSADELKQDSQSNAVNIRQSSRDLEEQMKALKKRKKQQKEEENKNNCNFCSGYLLEKMCPRKKIQNKIEKDAKEQKNALMADEKNIGRGRKNHLIKLIDDALPGLKQKVPMSFCPVWKDMNQRLWTTTDENGNVMDPAWTEEDAQRRGLIAAMLRKADIDYLIDRDSSKKADIEEIFSPTRVLNRTPPDAMMNRKETKQAWEENANTENWKNVQQRKKVVKEAMEKVREKELAIARKEVERRQQELNNKYKIRKTPHPPSQRREAWLPHPRHRQIKGLGKKSKKKKKRKKKKGGTRKNNISSIYKMGSCSANSEENFASVPMTGGRRRRRRSRRRRPRRTKKRKSKSRKRRRTVRKRRRRRR